MKICTQFFLKFSKTLQKYNTNERKIMFRPKTFQHLCNALQTGAEVEIDGQIGVIQSIQREDGSGLNYNVDILLSGTNKKYGTIVFFRAEF